MPSQTSPVFRKAALPLAFLALLHAGLGLAKAAQPADPADAAPAASTPPPRPKDNFQPSPEDGKFQPTTESFKQYQTPDWFRDAKFGIWSHWGPDSIPGISNNYAQDMYNEKSADYKWHLEHYGHPSQVGYKDVIRSWKAEKFDADALMQKYKAAGAKYFVALATHHDNFDNFDSSANPWNAVKEGPHKDIVGAWRDATLKAGLRFGVSSHADDRGWNYMWRAQLSDTAGPKAGVPYDGANPAFQSLYNTPAGPKDRPSQDWLNRWTLRHMELLEKYQPDLLYFDGSIPHDKRGMQLIAHYLNSNVKAHNGKLEAVVNVKSASFVKDYERGVSTVITEQPWQDDTSLSGWFYMNFNPHSDPASNVKSAATVIHTLADVVSKNGNLLMNFPQRGDGSLYPECEATLAELAKWMPINGEAIYGTRPWKTFGEGPSIIPAKHMNELKEPLTSADFRFTAKGDAVYAICLGVPEKEVHIAALSQPENKIASVELLGCPEKTNWKQDAAGLTIQPPAKWPCQFAVTYKVKMAKQ